MSKVKTRFTVVLLVFALLLSSVLVLTLKPSEASAAETAEEKALYFVDAGRMAPGNDAANLEGQGGRGLDPSWGAVAPAVSPFMTEYGYKYRGAEGVTLLNSVPDKPFFKMNNSTPDLSITENTDPASRWGFVYADSATGKPSGINIDWADWRIGKTINTTTGFETVRWTESGNDKVDGKVATLMYKFEVPENTAVNIYFGTGRWGDWDGDLYFDARVNNLAYRAGDLTNTAEIFDCVGHRNKSNYYSFGKSFTGIKEAVGDETEANAKSYVTIEFGASNTGTNVREVGVTWILVTSANYARSYQKPTSYIKGSGKDTVNMMPSLGDIAKEAQFGYYVPGTITAETKAALEAANDWDYVEGNVTTPDGVVTAAKILALPANTVYFADAGNDAGYNPDFGYGWTHVEGNRKNFRGWIDENYNISRRYTDKLNGSDTVDADIYYQFDNLAAGLYGVTVGANDPWEARTSKITLNGTEAPNKLQCIKDANTSVTNYFSNAEEGNLTLGILKDDKQPCFTYIHVFKAATVTYNLNYDGSTDTAVKVGLGKITAPAEPVRANYAFLGWYTDADCTAEFDFANTAVDGDITLYAKWQEATPRTVTFMNGTETVATVENVTHGTALTASQFPSDPTPAAGYLFAGWYYTVGGVTSKFDTATTVTADITVTPLWTVDPLAEQDGYTVAANTGSGDSMSLISNWHNDAHHGGKELFVARNTSIVVTLAANGGNNRDKGLVMSLLTPQGNRVNFTGTRTYWFNGNNAYQAHVETNGSYAGLTVTFDYTDKSDLLAAYGSDVLQVGKLAIDANGVMTYTVETYAGEDTVYVNMIGKVVYTIAIGDNAIDNCGVTFAFDPTGTATIGEAKVKYNTVANTEYTVTYNSQGGSAVSSATARGTTKITAPQAPEKEGNTFAGWYKEEACTTAWDFAADTVTADVTLYAKWTVNIYTVTFDNNYDGAPAATTAQAEHGGKVTAPATNPTRTGYTFGGWYREAACTTAWDFDTDTVTAATTLYAKWTAKTYTVTLNLQGGTYTGNTQLTFTYGAAIAGLPVSTDMTAPAGKVFRGWYTTDLDSADDNHVHLENGEIWTPEDEDTLSLTLYAHWGDKLTVNFNLNGGEGSIAAQHLNPGEKVTKPADPTRTGYTFAGWYTANDTAFDFENTEISSNVNLKAKWTANMYTVTFDYNYDGAPAAGTVNAAYDSKITAPANPTRSGYTFEGWYTDAAATTAYDFDTTVTGAITLYAKWAEKPAVNYTVTFDLNYDGAPNATTAQAEEESKVTKPADPTREGYTFGGWYTTAACATAWDFETDVVTADVRLYAKWTQNAVVTPDPTKYTVTFNLNYEGAPAATTAQVEEGSKVTKPADPTREGYKFIGWYTDASNVTNSYNFDTEITEDITLYAVWDKILPAPAPGDGNTGNGDKKGGCGSSVVASSVLAGITLLLASAVVLFKKKERNN